MNQDEKESTCNQMHTHAKTKALPRRLGKNMGKPGRWDSCQTIEQKREKQQEVRYIIISNLFANSHSLAYSRS